MQPHKKLVLQGSPDFEVIGKPHILNEEGITESRTVVLDTVYTINRGKPIRLFITPILFLLGRGRS